MLVILDLNGTILETSFKKKPNIIEDFKTRTKYIYLRPYLKEFLSALIKQPNVSIAVWTSCSLENAKDIIDHLCGLYSIDKSVFEFIYSRKQVIHCKSI
jgi:hypothetical protein